MKQRRIPRPLGTTLLAIEANKLQTDQAIDKLQQHLITYYALNGFRYQGQSMTLQEFSNTLQIPLNILMEGISNLGSNVGPLANPEQLHETAKSLITMGLTFSLQDRGLIQTQLETLLASQGPQYKPFITSEVNKVLKLMLESNKNIADSYKTFFTNATNTTNILNIHQSQDSDKDYLTPDQALGLLTNKPQSSKPNSLPADTNNIPNPSTPSDTQVLADKLFEAHQIGELPDVREGRTGTEALRALGPDEVPQQPMGQGAINPHEAFENRRGEDFLDVDSLPDSD